MDLRLLLTICALDAARLDPPEGASILWLFAPNGEDFVHSLLLPARRFPDTETRLRAAGEVLQEHARRLAPHVFSAPAAIAVLMPQPNGPVLEVAGPTGDAIIAPFDPSGADIDVARLKVPRDDTNAGALFGWVWAPERGSRN